MSRWFWTIIYDEDRWKIWIPSSGWETAWSCTLGSARVDPRHQSRQLFSQRGWEEIYAIYFQWHLFLWLYYVWGEHVAAQPIEAYYTEAVRFFQVVTFLANIAITFIVLPRSYVECHLNARNPKTCRMKIGYLYCNVGSHSLPFDHSHRKRSNSPEPDAISCPQVMRTMSFHKGFQIWAFLL
jgi:hypothetical protein